jgi:hypothetical protein
MPIDAGATYVFDLGYYEFGWSAKLDNAACRIEARLRSNTPLQVIETLPVAADADNIVSDQEQMKFSRRNPMSQAVREIRVSNVPGVISNDLNAPASEIAAP